MDARWFENLGISARSVENRVTFLQAYSNYSRELDRPTEPDRERDHLEPDRSDRELLRIDHASALVELGQLTLCLDAPSAVGPLAEAAEIYVSAGHHFGVFLMEAVAPGRADEEGFYEHALAAVLGVQRDRVSKQYAEPISVVAPQQEAYAFVGAASMAARHDFGRDDIGLTSRRSQHVNGVLPVGALGTPIHRFWAHGRSLLGIDEPEVLSAHLAAMCSRYAETVELAQVNSYLWSHLASPIDIIDIDIFGIAVLGAHHFGADYLLETLRGRVSGSGMALIELAVEFQSEARHR